jgi:hypothetical protein
MELPDRGVACVAQCVTIHPTIDPKIDDCMGVEDYDDLNGTNTSPRPRGDSRASAKVNYAYHSLHQKALSAQLLRAGAALVI